MHIIAMISLISDKLTLVKAGFSIKDSVHQGPKQSNTKVECPSRGFRTPKKAVQGHVGLYSTMGWDDAYQNALYPSLSATICRLVQVAV
jgi:hypothetical protein